ncbi:MAG: 5-bromo-4-chloroindolyl phosphate hydrolysis family protein [Eubacteriaceae bacterium]|nr:5-bromo-4-chloroindolyl phosphate hydrolysis family protein [Eubacteriaceae bacterium]
MARNNYKSTYYKVYRPKGVYGADVITVDMIDYRRLSSLAPQGAFWIAIGIFWLNLVSVIFPFFYSFGLIIYLIAKARDLMLYNRAKKYCALFASGKTRSIREICRYMGMSEAAVRADLAKLVEKRIISLEEAPYYVQTVVETAPRQTVNVYNGGNDTFTAVFQEAERDARKAAEAVKKAKNKDKDPMLSEAEKYIDRMKKADEKIDSEKISNDICRIEDLTKDICKRAAEDEAVRRKTTRFMDYYLPTTVKLMDTYAQLEDLTVESDNIASIKNDIEKCLDTIVEAFSRLNDSLYDFDAIDITSEIEAFKGALASDGLLRSEMELDMDAMMQEAELEK